MSDSGRDPGHNAVPGDAAPPDAAPPEGDDDRAWMRAVLAVLFDDYSQVAAVRLLRDEVARAAVTPLLVAAAARRGAAAIPPGERGDHLVQGLLALRAKFGREEAMAKVERNIALRGRPG